MKKAGKMVIIIDVGWHSLIELHSVVGAIKLDFSTDSSRSHFRLHRFSLTSGRATCVCVRVCIPQNIIISLKLTAAFYSLPPFFLSSAKLNNVIITSHWWFMAFVGPSHVAVISRTYQQVIAWFDAASGTNFCMEVPVNFPSFLPSFLSSRLFFNVPVACESSVRNTVRAAHNRTVQTGGDAAQSMPEVSPWAPRNSRGTPASPFYDTS